MSESWKLPGKLCDSRLSASATATQHGSLPRQLGPQIRCGSVAKQEYSAAGTLYCIWVLPSPWWNARKNPTCCMPSGRSIVRSIIALHFRLANVLFATMTVYQLVCPLISSRKCFIRTCFLSMQRTHRKRVSCHLQFVFPSTAPGP